MKIVKINSTFFIIFLLVASCNNGKKKYQIDAITLGEYNSNLVRDSLFIIDKYDENKFEECIINAPEFVFNGIRFLYTKNRNYIEVITDKQNPYADEMIQRFENCICKLQNEKKQLIVKFIMRENKSFQYEIKEL